MAIFGIDLTGRQSAASQLLRINYRFFFAGMDGAESVVTKKDKRFESSASVHKCFEDEEERAATLA